MKDATRKIISLFCVLLWFIPLLLILLFNIKQQAIRYKMIQKLEHEHLQKISIPEKDVIWIEDDEILVNDQMFDIHSYRLDKGMYLFEGLFDDEETGLVKQRNEAAEESNEENNVEHVLLSQLLKWLEPACGQHQETDLFDLISTKFKYFRTSSLISLSQKVPTPPPWFVASTLA